MRSWMKFGWPVVVLCLVVVAASSRGEPPKQKSAPVALAPEAASPEAAQNLVAVACPLYLVHRYEDYSSYYASLCDPNHVQYVLLDSFHNSSLGPCGTNPDCVPYGTFAHSSRLTDTELAKVGLPRLGDPAAVAHLGEGVNLLDEQLVDLIPESETPAAPLRIRLFLLKHKAEGSLAAAQLIGSGYEVRRDPAAKNVPLVHASRSVEIESDHTCVLRFGDVNYHVVLHHDTRALNPSADASRP